MPDDETENDPQPQGLPEYVKDGRPANSGEWQTVATYVTDGVRYRVQAQVDSKPADSP
jgi:hypothetical protein